MPQVKTSLTAILATVWLLANGPVIAQQAADRDAKTRCMVLGPVTVSAYIAFLQRLGQGEGDATGRRADNASTMIDLYDRLGCAMEPLQEAIECLSARLVDPETQALTTKDAQRCMDDAGMATR